MGYNQHQSFYLRDRWLGKAIRSIETNPSFFFEKDAFEKIGLGKNMVQSLRHWIKAIGIVDEDRIKKVHTLTPLGKLIKKYDITLKYVATAAILHYEITKQDEPSTAWYWFFNELKDTQVSREDLLVTFQSWVQSRETRVVSENSLKRDVDTLVRMYTAGEDNEDPEEVTLSPLANLQVMTEKNGIVYKEEAIIPKQDEIFLMYVLLDYSQRKEQYVLNIDDLLQETGLFGNIYNWSRANILRMLNDWTYEDEFKIVFTRTNNLDVIRVPEVDPIDFLETQYKNKENEEKW